MRARHATRRFPPTALYRLNLPSLSEFEIAKGELLADGPVPVFWSRREYAAKSFGIGRSMPDDVDRADYAFTLLQDVAGRADRDRTLSSVEERTTVWVDAAALRTAAQQAADSIRREWSWLVEDLRAAGALADGPAERLRSEPRWPSKPPVGHGLSP